MIATAIKEVAPSDVPMNNTHFRFPGGIRNGYKNRTPKIILDKKSACP